MAFHSVDHWTGLAVRVVASLQSDALNLSTVPRAYQRVTSRADGTATEVSSQQAFMLSKSSDGLLTDSYSCVSTRPTGPGQVIGGRMNPVGSSVHPRSTL